jgi:hypothetical protein
VTNCCVHCCALAACAAAPPLVPAGLSLLLLWYGLYFGILGRDLAEVASEQMVRGGGRVQGSAGGVNVQRGVQGLEVTTALVSRLATHRPRVVVLTTQPPNPTPPHPNPNPLQQAGCLVCCVHSGALCTCQCSSSTC